MTSGSSRPRARNSRSTAAAMFGNRNGSLNWFNRGWRKSAARSGWVTPRLTRHWASMGEILSSPASGPAMSGCDGAMDQRYFIGVQSARRPESPSRRIRFRITSRLVPGGLLPARREDRENDRGQDDRGHDSERDRDGDVNVPGAEQHLGADETQHERQTDLEEAKITDRPGQHEIERAQAENGKNVRRKNDERLFGHGENRRDGVHGEKQVG